MSSIKVQSTTILGPYRHYLGRAEYDDQAGIFHGDVVGTRDVITFQGKSLEELGQAFQDSVDDYLAFCASSGQRPEKPFSGKFITRVSPEVHKRLSDLAAASGLSLNQMICNHLEKLAQAAPARNSLASSKRTKSKRKRRVAPVRE